MCWRHRASSRRPSCQACAQNPARYCDPAVTSLLLVDIVDEHAMPAGVRQLESPGSLLQIAIVLWETPVHVI